MLRFSTLKALGLGDIHNIRRDSMLGWMMFIPLLLALLARIIVPAVQSWLLRDYGFDLTPYYPVLMSYFFILSTPVVFGTVIGFLLLDERDDQTLTALQITPLTLNRYLVYRLGMPIGLSFGIGLFVFPLFNLIDIPLTQLSIILVIAALEAPIFALFLATFAENKVAGFALMKGAGAILVLPVVAYFVPSNWAYLAGIIPTYWPMKVFWVVAEGQSVWPYFVIGLLYHILWLVVLLRRFNRVMHR